ncbi:CACTA en-spm transposon protein [Cucumis melo var. makuwa]|uniref:CACTA en-spm transposon protein n=1 Tax=Cucumis melo var. makuwa TaxID=1194695 RepID=A0A5A7U4B0_CUCMM|nr:CACTA en-spm transposon protein [Cucumis melo var. makuwa]
MKQNENFVTWAWDTRLFTRASMTVYCIEKSLLICNIVLHVARLGTSQAIDMCVRKTFSVRCLKWADVGREYIKVVKGDLQYELAEKKGESVDRVELFQETHVRAGTFVLQAAEDAHNQMLEIQSQPTPEGSQPLSEDEICDQVLGRRLGYLKGLGWGPKPKARRTASASSLSTSCSQSTEKEIELQAKLHEALERIEVQDRNHQALASQVESMKKMIEELTRAQQGPPHDP